MSGTIKVSKETKDELVRVAARIQAREGKRIDLDDAIKHLLWSRAERPDLLDSMFGLAPSLKLEDLLEERRNDEKRFKRKYGA